MFGVNSSSFNSLRQVNPKSVINSLQQVDLKNSSDLIENIGPMFEDLMNQLDQKATQTVINYCKELKDLLKDYVVLIAKQKAIIEAEQKLFKERKNIIQKIAKLDETQTTEMNAENIAIENKLKVLRKAEETLDIAYKTAIDTINAIIMFTLKHNTFNLLITPKSMVYKGPNITNEVSFGTGETNALNADLVNKVIDSFVKAIEIREQFYILPPEVFKPIADTYFLIIDTIAKVMPFIEPLLKYSEEPLPKWNDLRFSNPNFIMWSITRWGPTASKFFGLI